MRAVFCWQCGVEPTGVADVQTFGDPGPRHIPTGWPVGDHEHSIDPPTPDELRTGADAALARILEEWAR